MATVSELPSGKFRAQIRRKNLATLGKVFDTRQEAVEWGEAREAELVSAKSSAVARPGAGTTFADAVERYFKSPKFLDKAPGTQLRERSISKRVLGYFGNYGLAVINGSLVQDYIDTRSAEKVRLKNGTLSTRKVAPDSIRLEKAFLSAVFKFAKRRDLVQSNIMRDSFELPTCRPREGRITLKQQMTLYREAEELALSPHANPCLRPWVNFVFETGTRPGEAAKIELSWVDLVGRKISIPRMGQKKRNARIVLVADELVPMLQECVERARAAGSKYLFFSRANQARPTNAKGKPVRRTRTAEETAKRECTPYAYYHAWRNLCTRAGVSTKINPHIIRHEFICRLFEETDLNDSQIASLVGDVNVLSLEAYKHLRVERLRDRQDAHLDVQREALSVLNKAREQAIVNFSERSREMLKTAREEREAAGDFSTPIQRIHAAVKAEEALKRAARQEDDEEG